MISHTHHSTPARCLSRTFHAHSSPTCNEFRYQQHPNLKRKCSGISSHPRNDSEVMHLPLHPAHLRRAPVLLQVQDRQHAAHPHLPHHQCPTVPLLSSASGLLAVILSCSLIIPPLGSRWSCHRCRP